jgi:hypothetical protein
MKQQHISKLSLNRQTISNLQQITGGAAPSAACPPTGVLCPGTGCVCPSGETCGIYCPVQPITIDY